MHRAQAAALAAVGLVGLAYGAETLATASVPHQRAARAANSSGLSTTFTYVETDHGRQHGAATLGVKGHGTFTARLGTHSLNLALAAAAAGIPFGKIAAGGSYGVELDLGATGTNTGTAVVRFRARSLGSTCFAFTATGGTFRPGDSFVPTAGSLKVLGGTGAAARWKASARFALTAITGSRPSTYTFSGTARGQLARAQPPGRTCKPIAALIR